MKPVSKNAIAAFSLLVFTLIPYGPAWGRGESNPRAVAMGGAFTALGRGYDAPSWNPANLGLSDNSAFSINIFSIGMRVKNNSYSLSDYNRYNGQFLDDEDKEKLLDAIPESGLDVDLAAEMSAFNFSLNKIAFSYKAIGASSFTIDKDPFKLIFLGNAVIRDVSISNTSGEAYALGDFSVSYGNQVMNWLGGEMTAGAAVHYLDGLAYEKIIDAVGGVNTTDSGFTGSGDMLVRSSRGGSGYAIDLGMAMRFEKDWYFSVAWQNMASKVNWQSGNKYRIASFDMPAITFIDIALGRDLDSLVTTSDTSVAAGNFSTRLPPQIRLGLAKTYRLCTWSVDWEQTLFTGPAQGVNPRIAAGFEYYVFHFLPVRTGLGFGGSQGSSYSIGFGLNFASYYFDIGLANTGSPTPQHTKGIKLAIGMSLHF